MQRMLHVMGIIAILFVGTISPALGDYQNSTSNSLNDKYEALETEFSQKQASIDKQLQEKYVEIMKQYEKELDKINDEFKFDTNIDKLLKDVDTKFAKELHTLEKEFFVQYEEIHELFTQRLKEITDVNREYYGEYYSDRNGFHVKLAQNYDKINEQDWSKIDLIMTEITKLIPQDELLYLWIKGDIDGVKNIITTNATNISQNDLDIIIQYFDQVENKYNQDPDWLAIQLLHNKVPYEILSNEILILWNDSHDIIGIKEILSLRTNLTNYEIDSIIAFFERKANVYDNDLDYHASCLLDTILINEFLDKELNDLIIDMDIDGIHKLLSANTDLTNDQISKLVEMLFRNYNKNSDPDWQTATSLLQK